MTRGFWRDGKQAGSADIDKSSLIALAKPSGFPTPRMEEDGTDAVLDLRSLIGTEEPVVPRRAREDSTASAGGPSDSVSEEPAKTQVAKKRSWSKKAAVWGGIALGVGLAAYTGLRRWSRRPEVIVISRFESPTHSSATPSEAQAPPSDEGSVPSRRETRMRASVGTESVSRKTKPAKRAGSSPRREKDQPVAPESTPPATQTVIEAHQRSANPHRSKVSELDHVTQAILDQALKPAGKRAPAGSAPDQTEGTKESSEGRTSAAGELPDTPSRSTVGKVLGALLPSIRQCAQDQVGIATAIIVVRNDGRITAVAVGGQPFGQTPQGACMENVVRKAEFPPFRQSTFRVTYPFAVRPSG